MLKLKGLATGTGSLPHKDAEEALELVFRSVPHVPFWPQLPKRDVREGMVAQFSGQIPALRVTLKGLEFDPSKKEKELEVFYEHIIGNDIDYFKIGRDYALGLHTFIEQLSKRNLKDVAFIKAQVTGPFTFAASINDEKNVSLLHDPVFMQAIIKGLSMKALWQINALKKFGKKIILFIDEPYLASFGSAYTPINREDVIKGLSELTQGLESDDVLLGVHCCGNTDWSIFTQISAIDIINFDAFAFQERFVLYADTIKSFLKRGGIICWGIVPTQEFTGQETPDGLIERLEHGIDELVRKGVDRDLLSERLLISPSCGLGSLDIQKSDKILKLLAETSARLMDLKQP